jgi:diguanylate cyclase (GGDEF)-like protein
VSKRFSECVREGDVLARLGGDEFIALLPGAGDDYAALVAQRLAACLAEPFVLAQGTVTVGASIGVATRTAGQSTPEQFLREADAAMYRAKVAARATVAR